MHQLPASELTCIKSDKKQPQTSLTYSDLGFFYLHFILLQKQLFLITTGLQSQNTSKDSEQP